MKTHNNTAITARPVPTYGQEPAIVLVQLPGACSRHTSSRSVYPPLGLCQLAAMVPPGRCPVIDADAADLSLVQTIDAIRATGTPLVGMTMTSGNHVEVRDATRAIHGAGLKVIIGGPLPTIDPKLSAAVLPEADWFFRGEAEQVFADIVDRARIGLPLDGLPGIFRPRQVVPPVRLRDHAGLPFPTFAGLPIERYRCRDNVRSPMVTMMTSFGCRHRCAFCAGHVLCGRGLRCRPVNEVLDEIQRLSADGVREISFSDDGFTADRNRAIELCTGMIDREIDMTWFCNARADELAPDVLAAMKDAGCHQIYIGFESGDQRILNAVRKDTTVETMVRAADMVHASGITLSAGFIVGLPGEDDRSIAATADFIGRVRPDKAQFTTFTALPGTALYRQIGSAGFHQIGTAQTEAWRELLQRAWSGTK